MHEPIRYGNEVLRFYTDFIIFFPPKKISKNNFQSSIKRAIAIENKQTSLQKYSKIGEFSCGQKFQNWSSVAFPNREFLSIP
jgi:hypothetical protein